MSEGKPPFEGPTLTAVVSAILASEPPVPEHAGPLTPLIGQLLDVARRIFNNQLTGTQAMLRDLQREARRR